MRSLRDVDDLIVVLPSNLWLVHDRRRKAEICPNLTRSVTGALSVLYANIEISILRLRYEYLPFKTGLENI